MSLHRLHASHVIASGVSVGAVLWLPDVCCTCLHFFIFHFFSTYSVKFYIIVFVSSCCVQCAFDCRVLKSVNGIIGLESSSQFRVD